MVKPTGWVVDMRHYIDEATGDLPTVMPERVLSLAIFFGAIVAWVTDPGPAGHAHWLWRPGQDVRRVDQQLNEIAVSDRGTLRGLTQFCGRQSLPRAKPLNAKEIEERLATSSACAIIPSKPLASC